MAQSNWEADKMLDVYIYDYLLKRNLQTTAKAFMAEGKVAADPVAIDAPGGFLFEWWSVFWDIFIARTNEKHSEVAAAYLEAQQIKAREHQQQMQMQQLQLIQQRHAQMQRTNSGHPSLNGPINGLNSDAILGPSTASVLAAKMYEERLKHPHPMDSEGSQLIDASRMALLKSAATNHTGQLVPGNPGNVSTTLQQIQARNQQTIDIKSEGNMGVAQRSMPMDPSSLYGQGIIQQKPGLGGAGLNQGVSGLPLKGWPLTGIDQLRPNIGAQMQKPFFSTQSQFQLMSPQQQQQLLAQAQVQGNLNNSTNYGDMDPRRFTTLTRGGMNGKDGQPAGTDGCISSPMQSSSPKIRADQEYLMKMQQTSSQQSQEHLQQQQQQQQNQQQQQLNQQQMQQNNRKRKQATSSGPANSTGTGNTVGPSANSPPSTPSTHTPEGLAVAGNMRHVPKNLMMYGADGTGLASSSNQMDDLEAFGDVGSLDDNVESFLSNDEGDARDIFAALKSPTEPNPPASKGFTFSEVNCWRTSNSKIVCCNFSSDGKILASAGHEKKAVLWNMETFQTQYLPEEHSLIITDVRFRPNSTQLATSSFDRTVKLWNIADPAFSQHTFTGHNYSVTSLDFHPKKTELLCSCDGNGEIRYWNVTQHSCIRVIKGGTAQIRFQPSTGQFLAAASESVVSIFDVETHTKKYTLQGHNTDVQSVCWDNTGEYLASVSQDLVKVWSVSSGECIHEVSSNGNKFHSCVFHPSYTNLLVIGGYQSLELWNMVKNQSMTVPAHDGLIASLAQSPVTGMVASASHDNSVKLWK
ncbi:transcriptional corepressor LEUNIG_HOMOLOG-like [Triticum dicoccoides]|uniref:transcriptional corepressor LEUNIG_HOMOLOG-like n=1 Tax=Triticum dicoccoides TaxID=85692 RepID=UPI00162ED11C|nr:transcriptional corepressor LEUNIG_HOMOLOG-like [Triticum dicoccoides]XP_037453890.1 transcriptional corepressor LEUNIG_HOMOLOG-like [Triticum dicoccoides]